MIVAGSGPRAVVTTASYEARRYGVGSAMPASRARRLCPDAVVLAPDFATYREASKQVMDLVRAHVERVEVVGLDEAYLDVAGLFSPRAAMRRLVAEIKARDGADVLGRHRPEQARRQGRLRRREAGRLRRAQPRAGVRALCLRAAGPRAGHRPEDRSAAGRAGPDDARGARRGARARCWSSVLERTSGVSSAVAARFEHDGEIGAARKVVSESRERTFDTDLNDPAQMREQLSLMAEELCAGLAAHGRRGRTIAIKVRLDDWTTVTRARTIAEPTCDAELVSEIALELLRDYAPARAGASARRARRRPRRGAGPGGRRRARTRSRRAPARRRARADQLALPV